MNRIFLLVLINALLVSLSARADVTLLEPERVFDGRELHEDWIVLVADEAILFAGPRGEAPDVAVESTLELAGQTLLPGLIEGHSHVLLHPYNETPWNDQVLKESEAERVVRAVNHVRDSLAAGVTTMRDLGSEGAGYADVSVRNAIAKGLIPGPKLLVAGRAIVATGSYGPKGFHEGVTVPLGAETADGYDDLVRVVRSQIGRDIDFVKVYADYRWGPGGTAAATFSQEELKTIVDTARSSGRGVAAHASTSEAIRRAVLAGVETIEHGDGATPEVLRLMKKHGVALCPTLAAGDAISRYRGWVKGRDPEPARITQKRASFQAALDSGVDICFGGDVGVYPHGDNVRELEMMVDYGMTPGDALHAATAGNAELFHLSDTVGSVKSALLADLIAVRGNPLEDIAALRNITLVMKAGVTYSIQK
ncbi:metal-dependent hydrolase family protein [Congregibacter litoralis]|uniref:Imidazolonepropionase n=1 Tax=Congregibacter litoralis KT71 TaxID=314285 RepID=A4A7Z2_9GAMM|nr:amidohydrolase family protein [Congregibacter litoralis]EAQ97787.1 Imidazolonepropionase [Congregibacter litoralis KT71]